MIVEDFQKPFNNMVSHLRYGKDRQLSTKELEIYTRSSVSVVTCVSAKQAIKSPLESKIHYRHQTRE
jgi:hypothetical protein